MLTAFRKRFFPTMWRSLSARGIMVNFIDETSWYQHGVLAWLWVMVNPSVAFFSIKASRSKQAFEELIGHWAGILVSDGYGVYRKWVNQRQHLSCPSHTQSGRSC